MFDILKFIVFRSEREWQLREGKPGRRGMVERNETVRKRNSRTRGKTKLNATRQPSIRIPTLQEDTENKIKLENWRSRDTRFPCGRRGCRHSALSRQSNQNFLFHISKERKKERKRKTNEKRTFILRSNTANDTRFWLLKHIIIAFHSILFLLGGGGSWLRATKWDFVSRSLTQQHIRTRSCP